MDVVEEPTREILMPSDATCLDCGYALVHLQHPRCPECGRVFEPEDPLSFRTRFRPRQMPWLERRTEALFEGLRQPAKRRERVVGRIVLVLAVLAIVGVLPRVPPEWLWPVWTGLIGVIISATARGWGRLARGVEPDPKPIAGRWGWQAWVVLGLAALLPVTPTLIFWLQRPLFDAAAKEIEATELQHQFGGRYIGVTWVAIDRCPHGTFFQVPQQGNPLHEYVTLFHTTDSASCSFARGIPVTEEWSVWYGWGRRRPGSY